MGHVVVPRRSDGTLNRGLVCVAHQTWTIKIPTSLRKRICDCRLIQKCKQEKEKKMMSAPLGLQVGTGIHTSNSPQGAIKLIQYNITLPLTKVTKIACIATLTLKCQNVRVFF